MNTFNIFILVVNAVLFIGDFLFFIVSVSRIFKRFLLLFLYMIFVLLIRIFLMSGDLSAFIMLCHYMLFYSTYVGKLVGKVMRERGCCMANVGIRCYVIFRETISKWKCEFVYNTSLSLWGLGGVCALLPTNDLTRPLKMTSEMVESAWANIESFLNQLKPEVRRLVRRREDFKKETNPQYSTKPVYIYIYFKRNRSIRGFILKLVISFQPVFLVFYIVFCK